MFLLSKNIAALMLAGLFLSGCGSKSEEDIASMYSVGGTVSGLGTNKTFSLQNNNQNNEIIISANGKFTFPQREYLTATYYVTVKSEPQGQRCNVANGSGSLIRGSISNIRVVCLTSGSLDNRLDADGIVVHNGAAGGNGNDEGHFLALAPDGKILVTGYSLNDNQDMAIWRYQSGGTLDNNFNTNGIVVHDSAAVGSGVDVGLSMAQDIDGILTTGYSMNATGNKDMIIWRYNSSGALDSNFGKKGIVVHGGTAGGTGDDTGQSITLDGEGKILVTGYSVNSSGNKDMVIWRYNSDGTLDTSSDNTPATNFGTGGFVVHNNAAGGNGDDEGHSIALDAEGRILVTGYSTNTANNLDMVIWRYNPDGTIDNNFSSDGIVVHNNGAGGNGHDEGHSIALDAEGKILVTGYSKNVSSKKDMVIWRFNPDGSLDTSFDSDGIVVHDGAAGGNGDDEGRSLALDVYGGILVTGYSHSVSNDKDMVIWRYNPDGTLDSNFDTDGIVVHDNAAGGNGDDEGRSLLLDFDGKIMVTGYSLNGSNNKDMVIWRYNP